MAFLRHISHSRRRRVRKKHSLGEFVRFGFDMVIRPKGAPTSPILDAVIAAVEAEGLSCSGCCDATVFSLWVSRPNGTCTEADANRLAERLAAYKPRVGAFRDVWAWSALPD